MTKGRSRSRTYGRGVEDVGIPWSLGGTSLHSEILIPEPASPLPPAVRVGDGSGPAAAWEQTLLPPPPSCALTAEARGPSRQGLQQALGVRG